MSKKRFDKGFSFISSLDAFEERIQGKQGQALNRELLTRQPNVPTLTKKEFDDMLKDTRIKELGQDSAQWTYKNLNNMPYDHYQNLSQLNKLKLRERLTTPEGYGTRTIKNLNKKNLSRFPQSTGRVNKWVSFGRQRNVILAPSLPFIRFKPVPVLNQEDRVANKISNFMTFVDNTPRIEPVILARFEKMKNDILRFVGRDKYLINILKKDFKGVQDGVKDVFTLPINQDGLNVLQAWITDAFEDESGYEEGVVEFGDYQVYKDNLEVSFFKLENVRDKRTQFLPCVLTKNYNLDILQIYQTVEEAKLKYNTHCFVHSCKVLGIPEKTLVRLRHCIKDRPVRIMDYPRLCDILQRNIRYIKYYDLDKNNSKDGVLEKGTKITKTPTTPEGKKKANESEYLEFVCYDEHIMPNVKLPISSFSIKHYENVKNLNNFSKIVKQNAKTKSYSRSNVIQTTASILIKTLIETQSFEFSHDMKAVGANIDLSVNEVSADLYFEQRPYRRFDKRKVPLESIYYADLESLTSNHVNSQGETTQSHRNLMAGYIPHVDSYTNSRGEVILTKPHIFRCKTVADIKYSQAIYQMLEHIKTRNNKFYDEEKTEMTRKAMRKEGVAEQEVMNKKVESVYDYVIYFHNLKYDFSFIRRLNVRFTNICEKAGAIYSVSFVYKGRTFTLKDSFKMLPFSLAKFKGNLQLDVGKQDFDMYDYFNDDNLNNDEEVNYKGHLIKPISKYIEYLELDCITLKAGMKKLYESLKSFDSYLCIYNFLTISSLAYDYFGKKGCWAGLYEISGSVLNHVNNSSVGGRCCMKDNKKIIANPSEEDVKYLKEGLNFKEEDVLIILDMILEDFDMKSCYPSAIKISKLPIGYAKKLKNSDILELNRYYQQWIKHIEQPEVFKKPLDLIGDGCKYSHIIFELELKFTGYLQIPILSTKKDDGVRLWTNDINKPLTMSSVYLKDILETGYYKISSINISQGVYWDRGYNTKCQEIIQNLYNERLEYKDENNVKFSPCMGECLKLILNSIYGKCGLKASDTAIEIIGTDKIKRFMANNHDDIVYCKELNDANSQCKVKKNTYNHYNMAHISSLILENSKVLMNHVIKSAENIGCTMLYSDTDSFHLDKSKIKDLVIEYRRMFNKELIGNQLTQFSVDFAPMYVNDIKYNQHSAKFICPALKWYLDDLVHYEDVKDEKGEVIGQKLGTKTSQHVRNKGCDRVNLEHYIKVNNLTMTQLYISLTRGDHHEIDLCKGKSRFHFQNFGVSCRPTMLKTFKF